MITTFKNWLLFPKKGRDSGWRLLFGWKNILDVLISLLLIRFLKVDGFQFASKALFPAASIFVSMSIAWTSRAATIINDQKFRAKVIREEGDLEDYVYGFQLSLLVIMTTVIYIAIMAVGGLNFIIISKEISVFFSSFFLYVLLIWSVRECWSVVNFSNLLGLLVGRLDKVG
ncbi:hypothetical protein [Novosphingobium olei]|uniref:Uncharacterized protein n=1 Tax=Novosphingobium olei TaxID=2728851 RepID=A0A7Y0BMK5_9SPHN|nr:hypothetical protein [Novosphingobium olei]NML93152.1 hypothetical protein [Novosphingobium olei]